MRFMTMWIYKNTLNSEDSPEPNSHSKSLLLYYRYLFQSSSKIMKISNSQDTGQEGTLRSNTKSEGFRIEANGKYDSDRKLTQVAIISCIPELDFERSTFLSFSIIILEFHKDEHQRVCRMPDMNTIDHFIFNSYEYNIAFKS